MRLVLLAAPILIVASAAMGQTATTTEKAFNTPVGSVPTKTTTKTDLMGVHTDDKTEVKSRDPMGTHHVTNHCKTKWRHGKRVSSCKTSVHHHS